MQPLGEEEIDLLDVLLERRVAGGVVVDVVGGAQAFAGVQGNVGGLHGGSAVRGNLELLARFGDGDRFVLEGAVVALLGLEEKLGKRLHAGEADNKQNADDETGEGEDVEDATQALPAFALRVVEDRLDHRWLGFILAGRVGVGFMLRL